MAKYKAMPRKEDGAGIANAEGVTFGKMIKQLRERCTLSQIAAGVPIVTVAGRAGHARTSTTTDIYSHFKNSRPFCRPKTGRDIRLNIIRPRKANFWSYFY